MPTAKAPTARSQREGSPPFVPIVDQGVDLYWLPSVAGGPPGWAAAVEAAPRDERRERQRDRALAAVLACAADSVAAGKRSPG